MDSPAPEPQKSRMSDRPTPNFGLPATNSWRATPGAPGLMAAVGIVGLAALAAHLLRGIVPVPSLSLLFLVAVLVVSVSYGFWTGIASSLLAFLAYNFFFVEPLHTLRVAELEDFLALVVLMAAGATTGFLAGRMREEADGAKARAGMLEQLATFTAELAEERSEEAIIGVIIRHVAGVDDGSAVHLSADGDRLVIRRAIPSDLVLDWPEWQAAERAFRRGTEEARTAPGWSGSAYTFVALDQGGGVIGYRPGAVSRRVERVAEPLRRTMLQQGQVALERGRFARNVEAAEAKAEREALRAALLSSLSHDLKTPLATILGGVSSLRELDAALGPAARSDLLLAVEEEAGRLSRYVANLLHMTRLRTGLDLRLDWIDARDVAHGALVRARHSFAGRDITFRAPASCPLIHADPVLLEQALFNLIDNALKFSPPATAPAVSVEVEPDRLRITVADAGQGIPEGELPHVFEPFFRGAQTGASGTGLGLSIARGIVQALGGRIVAESPPSGGRGTVMHILLPLAARPTA